MTTLTTTRFEQIMSDMAKHYSQALRTQEPAKTYALPRDVIDALRRPGERAGTDLLHEWKNRMKTDSTDFSNTNQTRVTEAARQYERDQDSDGFARRINAQADHGKQVANQDIDAWRVAGIALGHQHPDQQSEILQAFHQALQFFTDRVVDSITEFIMNAVETLAECPYFAEMVGDIVVFFLAL
jgi:hypothetical protein